MNPGPVSAVIITRDAAATLAVCLDSLSEFPEVVILDNGSTDATISIAERYPNVTLHVEEFRGFGPTKQRAVELARHDWVFSIDADEHVDPKLVAAVSRLNIDDTGSAYEVLRHNRFMGRTVRHGGWGNDWLLRLFHRSTCRFNAAPVHENVDADAGVKLRRLDGPLWHEAVTDLNQFLDKIGRYTEIRRGQPGHRSYSPIIIVLRSFWAFIRSYVIQLGFLAGWRGLVIATCNSTGTFFKYMKLYADRALLREQERGNRGRHDDHHPPPA